VKYFNLNSIDMKKGYLFLMAVSLTLVSCNKDKKNGNDNSTGPNLVFKVTLDSTQARLNGFGQITPVGAGHAAQNPRFNELSLHYIELAPNALTALGKGDILYYGPETVAGGENAVNFDMSKKVKNGEVFFTIPLSSVTPGTYLWTRVSLLYQNFDINYRYNGFSGVGTVASFVGFNTYISKYSLKTQQKTLNANKLQGYWGFESVGIVIDGQAPATTVPNPINSTSPIPAGSCVVTGKFPNDLVITGDETQDVVVNLSFGTNKSFEWDDSNSPDGIYDPSQGDFPTDMGIRGLVPMKE
jgi:hypothetical protein